MPQLMCASFIIFAFNQVQSEARFHEFFGFRPNLFVLSEGRFLIQTFN
jgi:hypothetical protein